MNTDRSWSGPSPSGAAPCPQAMGSGARRFPHRCPSVFICGSQARTEPPMDEPLVRASCQEGLAWIEIHRPEKLNALNLATLASLCDAVTQLSERDETRVLLLTGAGDRAFAAGADIAEMNAQDASGI